MTRNATEGVPVKSFARRVATATGWNFLATLSERIIAFGVFVLIVRHIEPTSVGVLTLASVFIDMSVILTEGGLTDTLIRQVSPTERTYNTAFWTNLLLGAVMTLIVLAMAHPLGAIYHSRTLEPVLDVLSLVFVLTAASTVHVAKLSRDFGYRALAYRTMVANLIGGGVALFLAWLGLGIWALVAQRLVATLVSTVSVWIATRWVPRLEFSRGEFRDLMWFGVKVTGSTLCHQLSGTVVILVLGVTCGDAAVGFYRVAQRVFDVVTQFTIVPLLKVALSAFSEVQSDRDRLAKVFVRMTGAVSLVAIAAFIGLGALAGPAIGLMFGGEWLPSAKILTVMTIASVPMCCVVFLWPALTACGRPGLLQTFGILEVVLSAVLAGVASPWGVTSVAWSQVLRALMMAPYALYLLHRVAAIKPAAVLRELHAPAIAAALMGTILLLIVDGQLAAIKQVIVILIDIPLGIGWFGMFLLIVAPEKAAMLGDIVRRRLRRTPAPSVP